MSGSLTDGHGVFDMAHIKDTMSVRGLSQNMIITKALLIRNVATASFLIAVFSRVHATLHVALSVGPLVFTFLMADTQLYEKLCLLSIHPSVGWSVRPSIRLCEQVEKWKNDILML